MEQSAVRKVVVSASIENLADLYLAERGALAPHDIRKVEVSEALVDTCATILSLPNSLISQLGLTRRKTRKVRTADGVREAGVYDAVRLSIQGRDCVIDVADIPESCPVLVGQVSLVLMDWVVDPIGQRLIGNPEHNGEWMGEMFGCNRHSGIQPV
jgi:predicted aspartyl protease